MPIYWRRPHRRTTPKGRSVRVAGCWVFKVERGKRTYETRCPRCNDPVYYFANPRGRGIFLDSLGAPWPLHPCFDPKRGGEAPKVGGLRDLFREWEQLPDATLSQGDSGRILRAEDYHRDIECALPPGDLKDGAPIFINRKRYQLRVWLGGRYRLLPFRIVEQ